MSARNIVAFSDARLGRMIGVVMIDGNLISERNILGLDLFKTSYSMERGAQDIYCNIMSLWIPRPSSILDDRGKIGDFMEDSLRYD